MSTAKPTGRPVVPLSVEDSLDHVRLRENRRLSREVEMVLSEYDTGRIRAGYVCINCLEDLDVAFPDECPICNYPMATRQSEEFAKSFQGTRKLGPSTSLEEEKEIMQEMRMRSARKNGIVLPKPSVIVPRSL